MKKILFFMLVAIITASCSRDLEFDTISETDPALEVLIEGAATNNTYPKISGATVELYNSNNQLLATTQSDAGGKVLFTKQQLKEKGIFTVKASKGVLNGQGTTAYLLLNDGVTLLIITVQ